MDPSNLGENMKKQMREGQTKMGVFLNSGSTVVADQFAHMGYDWLLVDTQHGPMDPMTLSAMLTAISAGGCLAMVRVASWDDRKGIQTALDCGADGILIPYINNRKEAEEAVSCCLYPTKGTRSVYFPQRCTNKRGLLGYCGKANDNIVVAIQVETADCIKNIDDIMTIEGLDMAFLGQNDLCLSMGLYEKHVFPQMYFSDELNAATDKMIKACQKNDKILGLFLFGTERVEEFIKKGYRFISIGNDLHHMLTTAQTFTKNVEALKDGDKQIWTKRPSSLL